jgi:hypothetical protein
MSIWVRGTHGKINIQGIGARLRGISAKCATEESYMCGLMLANLDKAGTSERWEAGIGESLFVVFGKGPRVEGVLEMFECQGKVENGGIC